MESGTIETGNESSRDSKERVLSELNDLIEQTSFIEVNKLKDEEAVRNYVERLKHDPEVGRFLCKLVNLTLRVIYLDRDNFTREDKLGYGGKMNDLKTSVDDEVQSLMLQAIVTCLPGVGIVGEENDLRIPCALAGEDIYITLDPLDGTKAFAEGAKIGVGSMLALVSGREVVSAWVGDVYGKKTYGYVSNGKAIRVTPEGVEDLSLVDRSPVGGINNLLLKRKLPKEGDLVLSDLVANFSKAELKGFGSIGLWFARLWDAEFNAGLLGKDFEETPWDSTPVIGISQKLGFIFLRPGANGWEKYQPEITKEPYDRGFHMLVIHESIAQGLESNS